MTPSQALHARISGADSGAAIRRRRLRVSGTVQGVGFRPFLHRLARSLSLTGAAGNDDAGVWCEIQGRPRDLDEFEAQVAAQCPPLARVESVHPASLPVVEGEKQFVIAASVAGEAGAAGVVSPDVAPCAACLREIADPDARRHRYAFTCCTDCGPRYTVVRGLPYDRERTSMAVFELCQACGGEYRDPADRRHHAQAACCPDCGPSLMLASPAANPIEGDPVSAAAALLRAGRIVAVKGVGGYQLMCRADDSAAVARLRQRKHREEKPFALLVGTVERARSIVVLDQLAARALSGPEAPIVLAPRCDGPQAVAPEVAPGSRLLGVMLAATPLHALLAAETGLTLVCTSGNRSDEPIVIDDGVVAETLGSIADAILSHDRLIERRADDSVGHVVLGEFQLLRRARGYAPATLRLAGDGPTVLGVGAELKSTVCMAVGRQAHASVHLGDLEHPAALAAFERAVADLIELSGASPELVVHDLHPEYLSTKFASSAQLAPTLGVQHHHAHLASCLADAGHGGAAIGVMFDGLGWGADATIWGGEILVGDAAGYERVAHLSPVPLPGGASAVREPWRMALAHLWSVFGADLPALAALEPYAEQAATVLDLCRSGRSIPTTSMGRLFDAVAALCHIAPTATYEGQAAIRLEQAAEGDSRRYAVAIGDGAPAVMETAEGSRRDPARIGDGVPSVIETTPLIEAVVGDLMAGRAPSAVAGSFHRWVADAAVAACQRARDTSGVSAVALSGGVFQNRRLTELLAPELQRRGFTVLRHRQVPPNDGGISLGQAAIGRAALARRG